MAAYVPNGPFGDTFRSLTYRYGDRLATTRDATSVRWSLRGDSVRVAVDRDGLLDVRFVSAGLVGPGGDGSRQRAVYRRSGIRYRLDGRSSAGLVDDMVAFFEGRREPLFVFAAIESPEAG